VASGQGIARRVGQVALPGQLRSEIAPLLPVLLSVNRQLEWIDRDLEHRLATPTPMRSGALTTILLLGPQLALFPDRSKRPGW